MNWNLNREDMRSGVWIAAALFVVMASFFLTLAILDHSSSISRAVSSMSASITQALNPTPKIVKSDQLDLQQMSHNTGSIVAGSAIAHAPNDGAGALLYSHLNLGRGSYRVEITFSCAQNEKPNSFEITAINPSYKITHFELGRRAPACDGSVKAVALGFKLSRAPESVFLAMQYGGSGTLQIKKLILYTLSGADAG